MSVQKKSLISQRNTLTKAIVATAGEKKHATAKVAPKVSPKASVRVAAPLKATLHV
jgi:hypothetical protein